MHPEITPELRDRIAARSERVIVVTGASSGIGAAVAIDLSVDSTVIAVGRNVDRLAEVVAAGRAGAIIPLAIDLTDLAAIEHAFAGLERVDALINNAAVMFRTTSDATPEQWREMFDTNVFAPAELARVLRDRIVASRGTLVFIGSGASRTAVRNHLVYASSKHAVQALADGLRMELAESGVRVSTVAPGPTATDGAFRMDGLTADAGIGDRIHPTTVARSVRHVLDAPEDTQLAEVWVRPRVERR